MKKLRHTRSPKLRMTLLAFFTATTLLTPLSARAAERDGTVIFFSMEDLRQMVAHPSLSSLASLFSPSQSSPSFAWHEESGAAEQDNPLERNARYGNGLGADGYRLPGTRPLWGY
jgi:hypothetical protein